MTQRPFQLRAPNRKLESPIQERCATMLRAYLPEEVFFCASLSGVRLSPQMAMIAKRAGLQRGMLDFAFIFPDGVTRYIEMKAEDGELSKEQAKLQKVLGRRMAACRSWEAMKAVLTSWLTIYGLTWLTERESLQRYAAEREAKQKAKARPMRRRAEAVAAQP